MKPSPASSGQLACFLAALPLMGTEDPLAKPDKVRSRLDELVRFNVFDRTFQTHLDRGPQSLVNTFGRRAVIGEVLGLSLIHI